MGNQLAAATEGGAQEPAPWHFLTCLPLWSEGPGTERGKEFSERKLGILVLQLGPASFTTGIPSALGPTSRGHGQTHQIISPWLLFGGRLNYLEE